MLLTESVAVEYKEIDGQALETSVRRGICNMYIHMYMCVCIYS